MTGAQKKLSRIRIEQSASIAAVLALIATASPAQDRQEPAPVPEPSALIDYATVEGVTLRAHVFEARTGEPPHPAILFYFGGGWTGGNPQQFYPFAEPLAELGFVAISMEYRVRSRHDSTVPDSMADAFRRLSMGTRKCRRAGHRSGTHCRQRRIGRWAPRGRRRHDCRAFAIQSFGHGSLQSRDRRAGPQ